MCQKYMAKTQQSDHAAARKCLSTGECRVCKKITTSESTFNYEGCQQNSDLEDSETPICDPDDDGETIEVQDDVNDYADKNAVCRGCKKDGKITLITTQCLRQFYKKLL